MVISRLLRTADYIVIAEGDVFLPEFYELFEPRIKHGSVQQTDCIQVRVRSVFDPWLRIPVCGFAAIWTSGYGSSRSP